VKAKLKSLYKSIDKSHPSIGTLIRRIHLRKAFDDVTRKIHGNNNTIICRNVILSKVTFDIDGDNNYIEVQDGCILSNLTFFIRGNNHRISISNHCTFSRGQIWIEDRDCSLTIGEKSTFGDVHLALTEPGSKIEIGCDCMFSTDIDIRTGDSHSIISRETNERINYAEDIFIGNHVWIAAHCILLKGAMIPENSVVASGAVVTRRFKTTGVIIGGNPSIQLKEGITWSRERTYMSLPDRDE